MKAGNVIAMAAFEDADLRASSPYELVLLLYAGEEGAADANELRDVLAEVSWLREASLAIVLEPTDGEVQLGCLGGLHALLTFRGQQAHSARPWHGRNALTMAGAFLDELERDHVREVDVDGIVYRDVWSATQAWTDGLGPGPRPTELPGPQRHPGAFHVNLNLRFAPSRDLAEAEAELFERVGDRATVEIVDRSPPAPPHLDEPVVRRSSAPSTHRSPRNRRGPTSHASPRSGSPPSTTARGSRGRPINAASTSAWTTSWTPTPDSSASSPARRPDAGPVRRSRAGRPRRGRGRDRRPAGVHHRPVAVRARGPGGARRRHRGHGVRAPGRARRDASRAGRPRR
jgi:hypothetical protein